jgi:hypothetical protein
MLDYRQLGDFLSSTESRLALPLTHPASYRIDTGVSFDHSHPLRASNNNTISYTSGFPYIFMAWFLGRDLKERGFNVFTVRPTVAVVD